MLWLMEILTIYPEERLLIKHYLKKQLILLTNPKYDGYRRGLASMVCKFFHKKTAGNAVKNEIMKSKELPGELHKSVIRKFEMKNTLIFQR